MGQGKGGRGDKRIKVWWSKEVHFLAHSGCVVQEPAAADYLLLVGGNDINKPATPESPRLKLTMR